MHSIVYQDTKNCGLC